MWGVNHTFFEQKSFQQIGGSYTVQGDILVYPGDEEKMFLKENDRKKENIPSSRNADKRDVTAFEYRLWPDAILPYKMQRSTIGNFNICGFFSFYQFGWVDLTFD